MSKGKGILGALEDMGILDDTGPKDRPEAQPSPPSVTASIPTPMMPSASSSVSTDPDMVSKIRAAVTASTHAPRLTTFLANLETAKVAIPNDERSAVTTALAFSRLTSDDIRDELTKAVAAALIEAEHKIKGDVDKRRESLKMELDTEAERLRSSVTSLEEQIRTLQGQLGTAQTALSQIDATRTEKKASIDKDESTALASLSAVKAELGSISSLLP